MERCALPFDQDGLDQLQDWSAHNLADFDDCCYDIQGYMPLGLIANVLSLQPYAAHQKLLKNRILPMGLPNKCSCIFRRKDLTVDVVSKPLDWQKLAGGPERHDMEDATISTKLNNKL